MVTESKSAGDLIRAELESRGWTQADLATVIGKHLPAVSQVIKGKRSITPEMAVVLSSALGRTAEFWVTLDAAYRVSLLGVDEEVERRAKLFNFAPIKEMRRRGWIGSSDSIEDQEKALRQFFNVSSLDDQVRIHANARQPLEAESLSRSQVAWCVRAGKLASVLDAARFDHGTFEAALPEIRKLADYSEKVKYLPKVLADAGVRLVVVEPLPHAPIDGAAFWLTDDAPVVVLSVRYDRIDCLWHTLAHELMHVFHRDSQSVDLELVGEASARDLNEIEARANQGAADFLIPAEKLKSFMVRVKPFYSKQRIVQFAHRMKVHPGIVSGQLQFQGQIGWHSNRDMLVKVRNTLTTTAMTDGWGQVAPVL